MMHRLFRIALPVLVAAATAATLFVQSWPVVTGRRLFPANISEWHVWLATFIVALAYAVVLGLPAYLLVRWLNLTMWWVSLICGFIIGAGPTAILFWPEQGGIGATDFGITVIVGICGSFGGFMAWLTWHLLGGWAAGSRPAA